MSHLSFRVDVQGPDHNGDVNVIPVLLVDGTDAADFSVFGLDLNALVKSRASDGEHILFTCWCGVPECARVERGVEVSHSKGTIQWTTFFPMKSSKLSFDAASYGEAIDNLLQELAVRWRDVTAEYDKVNLIPYGCDSFINARSGT